MLEKAAANVSVINGTLSPERAQAMSERGRSGISAAGGDPYSAVVRSPLLQRGPYMSKFPVNSCLLDFLRLGSQWDGEQGGRKGGERQGNPAGQ